MPLPALSLHTMTLKQDGFVAVLTLTRSQALNAMNEQFFTDFTAILTHLSQQENSARALLITAEGNGFCAGADLKEQLGEKVPDLSAMLKKKYNPLILGLKNLPIPTIVAVNGAAAGAGFSLICACDIAVAAENAYFLQAFINIALIPDAGSTYFLPRLVGRARAASLMMLGEKITAAQALDYGIISQVFEQDDLQKNALALAHKLAAMPTQSLFSIRKLLDSSETNSLEEQLDAEANAQRIAGYSEDFKEGIAAFLQKKPALFKGK